jgi:adenylate kinase family enzyme
LYKCEEKFNKLVDFNPKINLVTSFFNKKTDNDILVKRNNEFNLTLIKNLESPFIKKIHLFIEDEYSLSILNNIIKNNIVYNNKIIIIKFNKQPMYSDFFNYSFNNLKEEIVMIANSDIYLDKCDNYLLNKYIQQKNNVFSLTRYENENDKPLIDNYIGSHDAYIFKSPLNNDISTRSNFTQNNWGSENLVNSLIINNNYTVLNPCFQIKIIHNHETQYRNEDRKRINNKDYMDDYETYLIYPTILD